MPYETLVDNSGNPLGVTGNPLVVGGDPRTFGTINAVQDTVTLPIDGVATAQFQFGGTFTGTITMEGVVDNSFLDVVPLNAISQATGGVSATVTAKGVWFVDCAGYAFIRARATAAMTGAANVAIRASLGANKVMAVPPFSATALFDGAGPSTRIPASYDGTFFLTPGVPMVFNAVGYDRLRGNTD